VNKLPDQAPKTGKNRPQKAPNRHFPNDTAADQRGIVTQADISLTNTKAQVQPDPAGTKEEQKV